MGSSGSTDGAMLQFLIIAYYKRLKLPNFVIQLIKMASEIRCCKVPRGVVCTGAFNVILTESTFVGDA